MSGGAFALPLWVWLVALLVILLVVLLSARPRPLRVRRLWIGPGLFLGAATAVIAQQGPPRPLAALAYGGALAVGAAFGWWTGRHTEIRRDADGGRLTSQISPFGLIVVLSLVALRLGLRDALSANAGMLRLTPVEIADAFLLMAVGLVCAHGVELWLRASRLLRGPGAPAA